ncbi:hypothetical protein BSKO_09980 [Bryopsis sp. KO-2023]|nr:hypothetical protein BSKO_09980 [Bryopsis sp. KO-2023]
MEEDSLCLRELLRNLPSRGNLTTADIIAKPLAPYLCKHETQAPASQVIRNEPDIPILRSKRVEASKESQKKTPAGKSGPKRKITGPPANRGRKKSKATPESSPASVPRQTRSRTRRQTDG